MSGGNAVSAALRQPAPEPVADHLFELPTLRPVRLPRSLPRLAALGSAPPPLLPARSPAPARRRAAPPESRRSPAKLRQRRRETDGAARVLSAEEARDPGHTCRGGGHARAAGGGELLHDPRFGPHGHARPVPDGPGAAGRRLCVPTSSRFRAARCPPRQHLCSADETAAAADARAAQTPAPPGRSRASSTSSTRTRTARSPCRSGSSPTRT